MKKSWSIGQRFRQWVAGNKAQKDFARRMFMDVDIKAVRSIADIQDLAAVSARMVVAELMEHMPANERELVGVAAAEANARAARTILADRKYSQMSEDLDYIKRMSPDSKAYLSEITEAALTLLFADDPEGYLSHPAVKRVAATGHPRSLIRLSGNITAAEGAVSEVLLLVTTNLLRHIGG